MSFYGIGYGYGYGFGYGYMEFLEWEWVWAWVWELVMVMGQCRQNLFIINVVAVVCWGEPTNQSKPIHFPPFTM